MKKKYIILLIILLVLSILYYLIETNRNLTKPEIIIKETILSIESLIIKPLHKKEPTNNYDLKIELEETKRKMKELEELLNVNNNLSDYEIVNATVINRSISNWYNTLTIDKGLNQGIKNNMAVITNSLIGKIEKVSDNYSSVKLLTSLNDNFKISVKIEDDEYIYGILDNYKDGYFRLTGLSYKEIKENLKVETTGLDDIFPSGILIGYTEKQEKDNMNLENIVYVKSSADLDNINYVTILKRKIQ